MATLLAILGPSYASHATRHVRIACRDGGGCDLDDACDGVCTFRLCGPAGSLACSARKKFTVDF